jgi:hypothetical protein
MIVRVPHIWGPGTDDGRATKNHNAKKKNSEPRSSLIDRANCLLAIPKYLV